MRLVFGLCGIALLFMTHIALAESGSDYVVDNCQSVSNEIRRTVCKETVRTFDRDFRDAMQNKDIDAQRNVALCFSGRCEGAVMARPITGCAWRIAIVSLGSPEVNSIDTTNLKLECGKLDEVERLAATAQAAKLVETILSPKRKRR